MSDTAKKHPPDDDNLNTYTADEILASLKCRDSGIRMLKEYQKLSQKREELQEKCFTRSSGTGKLSINVSAIREYEEVVKLQSNIEKEGVESNKRKVDGDEHTDNKSYAIMYKRLVKLHSDVEKRKKEEGESTK